MSTNTRLIAAIAVLAIAASAWALVSGVVAGRAPAQEDVRTALSQTPPPLAVAPTSAPRPTPAPTPAYALPTHLIIPAIGVDAPLVPLGLDASAIPEVPATGSDAGWYDFSARPGQGSNVVLGGHLQLHQVPAVFWNLDELQPGDLIQITTESGRQFAYKVTTRSSVSSTDPDSVKVIYPTSHEMLTLITCGGTWIANPAQTFGGNYSLRTVVQAVPVASGLGASPAAR